MNGETEPHLTPSPDGVDVTLIRWFLTLTPAERLTALEEHLDDLEQIRDLNRHDPIQGSSSDSLDTQR
jgi:hypothetical protein